MRRSTATGPATLVGLVLLVSGCGAGAGTLPDPLPTDVPYAYHLQTEPGGDDALLEGTLELQDGCLVVLPAYEGMDEPVVPVVPIAATDWDGTTLTVNGDATAVGDQIALGGGYYERPPSEGFVPESCPPAAVDRYFAVGLE